MNTCLVPGDRRGGKVLIHNGFRYCKRSHTKSKVYWVCTSVTCNSRLQTNLFDYSRENIVGLYGNLQRIMRNSTSCVDVSYVV